MNTQQNFQNVVTWFKEISKIPRGSYNVSQISHYLVEFAKCRNLEYMQDKYFNVIIKKAASIGYEKEPTIILQGHMDIVAVKTQNCSKDLMVEGLDLATKDGYLYAIETSLGADDGIAIAYMLALLDSEDIVHPALEMVITTEEEVGMEGATNIDLSTLQGKILLNIDSEEEGIFLVGCAGGARFRWTKSLQTRKVQGCCIEVGVQGLRGGHSGVEIHKQRENGILLLVDALQQLGNTSSYGLGALQGGVADNAIPTSATASIIVDKSKVESVRGFLQAWGDRKKKELVEEIHLEFTIKEGTETQWECIVFEDSKKLLEVIQVAPNGVQKMSDDVEGLVETSLNLGTLQWNQGQVIGTYAVRSSIDAQKETLVEQLFSFFSDYQCSVEVAANYPGWQYNPYSPIRKKMLRLYEKMYAQTPIVEAIHAGLECGLFVEKIAGLDCISFGPNILDIHTTDEKLELASAQRVWEFILELLKMKES